MLLFLRRLHTFFVKDTHVALNGITIAFYKESYWNLCLFIFVSRHSDVNLAVMDNSSVKEEDQTLLLEEGGQAVAAKPAYASFTSQILRFSLN